MRSRKIKGKGDEMMQCLMCGREISNPEANYCEYCGTAVKTDVYREEQVQQTPQQQTDGKPVRVPTSSFLGVMCLPLIPFVGGIVYLVYLFYWAFSSGIEDSRKSWARATLIYAGIYVGLVILVLVFVAVLAIVGASSVA